MAFFNYFLFSSQYLLERADERRGTSLLRITTNIEKGRGGVRELVIHSQESHRWSDSRKKKPTEKTDRKRTDRKRTDRRRFPRFSSTIFLRRFSRFPSTILVVDGEFGDRRSAYISDGI